MTKRDDYLDRAAICVKLAAFVSETTDKIALLHMAECWREMAKHTGEDEGDRPKPSDRT